MASHRKQGREREESRGVEKIREIWRKEKRGNGIVEKRSR